MSIIIKWVINALLFLAVANLVQGIHVASFGVALIVALLWGLINITLKPLLVVLTLPVNILTLGLFTFIINAFLFWFLARIIEGFTVETFWAAFLGALILSLFNWVVDLAMRKND